MRGAPTVTSQVCSRAIYRPSPSNSLQARVGRTRNQLRYYKQKCVNPNLAGLTHFDCRCPFLNGRWERCSEAKMEEIAGVFGESGEIEWTDGLSIHFDDRHFNLRPSNTEPLLRLSLEATSKVLMEQKRDAILKVIQAES